MRVKFKGSIELCKKVEKYGNGSVLRLTTLSDDVIYIHCIDRQEAEDLFNEAYANGYINVSERSCRW